MRVHTWLPACMCEEFGMFIDKGKIVSMFYFTGLS